MNTETGSRKREKNGSFCLKHVQGCKDSAAHSHPNFPQVPSDSGKAADFKLFRAGYLVT